MTSPYLHGVPSLSNEAMLLLKVDESLPDFLTKEEKQKLEDEFDLLKFLIRLKRQYWEAENNCTIFVEPLNEPRE